jgi:hypothetical protein
MTLPLTLSKSGAAGTNQGVGNGSAGNSPGGGGGADVWTGSLSTPQGPLPIEFDLSAGENGTVKSPSQQFTAPLHSSNGGQLTIQVPSINGTFSGTVSGNQASGTWTQNGMTLLMALSKQP